MRLPSPCLHKMKTNLTRSAVILVYADSSLGNFGSGPCPDKRLHLKV
jgi:hypothetical protein